MDNNSGKIVSVCWNLTSRCNCACGFCFRDITTTELTLQENKQILEKLTDYGIKKISFTGGEVTLYKDLWELVKYSHEFGIYSSVITNGTLVNEEFYENLSKYADCLSLPLDALDENIQQMMGRGLGHSERIFQILEDINSLQLSIDTKINTVVTKTNICEIKKLYSRLYYHGVRKWKLFEFTPLRYHAIDNKNFFELKENEFNILKTSLIEKNDSRNKFMEIIFQDSDEISNSYFVILSDGSIAYDESGIQTVVGNLKYDGLDCILSRMHFNYFDYYKRHGD